MSKFFDCFRKKPKITKIMALHQELECVYTKLDKINSIRECFEKCYYDSFEDFYSKVENLCFDDMPSLQETDGKKLLAYLIDKQENLQIQSHSIIEKMLKH